jgi:hypothetical protein
MSIAVFEPGGRTSFSGRGDLLARHDNAWTRGTSVESKNDDRATLCLRMEERVDESVEGG